MKDKATTFQELMETRILPKAQTQQYSTLAQQMEVLTGRESDSALEKMPQLLVEFPWMSQLQD